MKNLKWFGFILVLVATGCSSSKITTSWKAENIVAKQYKKILVLGLINEPDRTIREKIEEHIVGDLKKLGYSAVCSCDEFHPDAFQNMTEKQAIDKLGNSGIDAVLTVVLLNKTKEKLFVQGGMQNVPNIGMQSDHHFWGYYKNTYERIFAPGYYVEAERYFWGSNFYELDNKNLLYSVKTQTFDPANTAAMAHEYGKMIVNNMVKQKILTDKRTAVTEPER